MHLARGGARVLLADKARFPRDKPCGGGLTGRALRYAPCDVEPVVEHVVDRFVVRVGYRGRFARRSRPPLIRMTQRRRLDAHLAEEAARAGADFRDGSGVGEIVPGRDGVTALVGGSAVHAGFVVGADGANGVVARAAGLGEGIVTGVALEGNVPWSALEKQPYEATAWVELGVVPGRVRLGLPERRPREPRRRGLDRGRPTAPRSPRAPRASTRARAGRRCRHARPPPPDATARERCGPRPDTPRRRRGRARRPSLRRRDLRGVGVRTPGCRRDPRAAGRRPTRRPWPPCSTITHRPRGPPSGPRTASRAPATGRCGLQACSRPWQACSAATSATRATRVDWRVRRFARWRVSPVSRRRFPRAAAVVRPRAWCGRA